MQRTANHRVLLIGSGLMTPPLIDHMMSFNDTHLTVASNLLGDAQNLCKKYPSSMDAVELDVFNAEAVSTLVKKYELVISFIPPWLHMHVVGPCVKHGVNVTTSSYVSPDMLTLDAEAKSKGVVVLNECGLDPGIDIMGTMKVVHECEKRNWKVVSYESYCGGIPVAEQADNPLGYKFSWNPGAAIKASRNTAIYFKNGKRVVAKEPLKTVEYRDDVSPAMKFEVYPNRDSTVFMDRFGMQECETFIRGTFRFRGFSGIISAFHDIGITSDDPVNSGVSTLRDLVQWRFTKMEARKMAPAQQKVTNKLTTGASQSDRLLIEGVLGRVDTSYIAGGDAAIEEVFTRIVKSMRFLGFMDDSLKLKTTDAKGKPRACLDAFGDVMADRMAHTKHDRDLVVMRHNFVIENEKKERWGHTSTWIESGMSAASGGISLMSKSVGVTCAIAARLVLTKQVKKTGILSPMYPEIYEPIMHALETKYGIAMVEESERPDGLPVSGPRTKLCEILF